MTKQLFGLGFGWAWRPLLRDGLVDPDTIGLPRPFLIILGRDHLGVETQRQWSDWAIARTTTTLFGLFSLVTLLANTHAHKGKIPIRQDAWYCKPWPTFSDALALVRQELWQHRNFHLSQKRYNIQKMQPELLSYLNNAAFYTP
ncbi:MAG: hypothetical protein A2X25_09420 [Chloroflexi bacterium GWB2_49_20]|nr:MAG: hypothetical protein A2X25_09420 [Chloroflexi bacterium GWB2_49_20]OGN79357.1 MAG: hypothetical protein A2X26_04605 [Chloroflexi bacterium GWC2_49_37]OGN82873.1 MAG: hypothetical protein A2X27_08090 [Chloroflexi bacterium GWD2_49_16]HCC78526.1 hypothetical protein [Anaerolineae bacterium]HCM97352.1 hypothetical protein [Anaerolineae bacterium]